MRDKTNKRKEKKEIKVPDLKPEKDPKGGIPPGPMRPAWTTQPGRLEQPLDKEPHYGSIPRCGFSRCYAIIRTFARLRSSQAGDVLAIEWKLVFGAIS